MSKIGKPIGPWRRLKTHVAYDNPWISVHHDQVITPAGTEGIYGRVHFKSRAIGIVTLDDQLNTVLVGQHRYALDAFSWEIPMGGGRIDEELLQAAKRELQEETGLSGGEWQSILSLHTSNSVTDEAGCVFLATNLSPGEQALEDSESDLKVRVLPFSDALSMIDNREITDAVSIAGLLATDRWLRTQKLSC